jgi:2-methylcitrate dehydratase PrpD
MATTPEAGPAAPGTDAAPQLDELAAFVTAPSAVLLGPPDHRTWAAARLLDGLGVIIHGSDTSVARAVRTAVPPGSGELCAWPDVRPAYRQDDLAFLLGVAAFSENFCDTGLGSVAHVNSIVVPALLVAMQLRPVRGVEALAALVVGYDVMEWAAGTLNGGRPRMTHQLRGFRPTATAGPLAAVAVLGRLAGLGQAEISNALGLACSQGGGLRPSDASPTAAIRIQSGEALRRAVSTLALSQAGIISPRDMLNRPGGWFAAYLFGEPGPYAIPVAGQPEDLMMRVSMKLECTPHTLVTMLDLARVIAARRAFSANDVRSVVVRVPAQHNVISGGNKPFPSRFSEAAMHVPFAIATAMITGSHLYPHVIEDGIENDEVRALTPKVSLVVDDALTSVFDDDPTSWPAAVEVAWADGTADSATLRAPETSGWTAGEALEHAAEKTEVLLDGRAGDRSSLAAEFADVASWPDVWQHLIAHPMTTEEKLHGN